MGKKKKKETIKIDPLDCYNKLRKIWKINPTTKKHKSKKDKSRQQKKIDLKKEQERLDN